MTDQLQLPDVNVLVALTNPSHVLHWESHRWLTTVSRFATSPVTESGLLRMLLNPTVTGQRVSPEQALAVLSRIRGDSRAEFLIDDSSLADTDVDTAGLGGHRQVTDWHLSTSPRAMTASWSPSTGRSLGLSRRAIGLRS